MAVQAGAGGTVLAGALVVDATIPAQVYQGSAVFAGAGNLLAQNNTLVLRSSAAFAASGNLAGNIEKPALIGSGVFAGVGALIASTKQFNAGLYDETGATGALALGAGAFTELEFGFELNTNTLVNGDILTFRVYRDGVALTNYDVTPTITVSLPLFATALWIGAGNLSVDATIPAVVTEWAGSALLAGAGNLAGSAQLLMQAQAVLVGSGTLSATPQLWMRVQTAPLTAAGSFLADTWKFNTGSVAFAGAGQQKTTGVLRLVPDQLTVGAVGNFASSARLLMQVQLNQSGAGGFSAVPQLQMNTVLQFGGAGSLIADSIIKGLINASVLFSGVGNFSIAARQWMTESFAYLGEGQLTAIPQLRMRSSALMAGAGLMEVDLRFPEVIWQGQAIFAGIGNFDIDTIRFINALDEQWSGAGSFDGASSMFLPSDAQFAAEGLLSVEAQNQMFAEVALGASGSMRVDAQRFGSDAGRFICDLDADMSMGDLMAAVATGSLNTTTETNSINTTIRCH